MIRITSTQDGFRRAGMAHPAEPTEYPDRAFSPEALAALMAEPMLQVEMIPDAGPDPEEPGPETTAKPKPRATSKARKTKAKGQE